MMVVNRVGGGKSSVEDDFDPNVAPEQRTVWRIERNLGLTCGHRNGMVCVSLLNH